MADLKISQLTDGGNAQAADEFVVARSGANYRIDGASVAAAATSVGTLTSLTVSGDLTVDTNTLSVNAANNRVGIGTTSAVWNSAEKLVVSQSVDAPVITGYSTFGAGTPVLVSWNSATSGTREHIWFADSASGGVRGKIATNGANGLQFLYGSTVGMSLDSSGNFIVDTNTLYVDAANNRVGVGTASPAYNLQVNGAAPVLAISDSGTSGATLFGVVNGGNNGVGAIQFFNGGDMGFDTGATGAGQSTKMRLTASGNLGLGVTPSAWGANYRALDIGLSSFWAQSVGSAGTFISTNAFFDGTNFKYKTTAAAAYYLQAADRSHIWYQAASGTAGNNISFTQAMTLDASGNLGVGTTATAGVRLHQLTTAAIAEHRIECSDTSGVFSRWKSSAGDIGYYGQANVFIGGASSSNLGIASATGAITFATGSPIAERARISLTGSFTAQASTSVAAGTHSLQDNGSSPNTVRVYNNTDSNNTTNRFIICDAGASVLRAEIRSNGGLANYTANDVNLSDERVKTDIQPAPSYWDTFKVIEIVTFKYKDQTHDDVNVGVIAQQVEQVNPVWVDTDGFGETPEGEEPLKAVYSEDIKFAAIKALQEAMARIEALEARLEALEA